jgi:hypothetical protein
LEVLPFAETDLQSGIIPVRYRVFDPDKNAVDLLRVTVDFQDGQGPQPANEFPAPPSEGSTGLCVGETSVDCILDPDDFGKNDKPFHTFLWDALSQPFSESSVRLFIQANDKQMVCPITQP